MQLVNVMNEKKKITKGGVALIIIAAAFVFIMLVLPLGAVIFNSLRGGIHFYLESLNTEYVISALKVTLLAAAIALAFNTVFGLAASWPDPSHLELAVSSFAAF